MIGLNWGIYANLINDAPASKTTVVAGSSKKYIFNLVTKNSRELLHEV